MSDMQHENIIDSRDVIAAMGEDGAADAEYAALLEAMATASGEQPEHGIIAIRDSHFTEYAEELAVDIGAIDDNTAWPLTHIDWATAAGELQMDYTDVEFRGVTYWVR
jgi:hypothetical protein